MPKNPMKKWCKDTWFALTHPIHWVRNHPTSKELDAWFNKKMGEGFKFENIRTYSAYYDGFEIWIANHPYSSFRLVDHMGVMPKRRTVAKLKKLLVFSLLESGETNG